MGLFDGPPLVDLAMGLVILAVVSWGLFLFYHSIERKVQSKEMVALALVLTVFIVLYFWWS
jgi:hypothetical protein